MNHDPWWWLSFADSNLPEGSQFLGACIVQGTEPKGQPGIRDCISQSHLLGLNPGGEIKFVQIPDDRVVPEQWRERLLNREECAALEAEMVDGT